MREEVFLSLAKYQSSWKPNQNPLEKRRWRKEQRKEASFNVCEYLNILNQELFLRSFCAQKIQPIKNEVIKFQEWRKQKTYGTAVFWRDIISSGGRELSCHGNAGTNETNVGRFQRLTKTIRAVVKATSRSLYSSSLSQMCGQKKRISLHFIHFHTIELIGCCIRHEKIWKLSQTLSMAMNVWRNKRRQTTPQQIRTRMWGVMENGPEMRTAAPLFFGWFTVKCYTEMIANLPASLSTNNSFTISSRRSQVCCCLILEL